MFILLFVLSFLCFYEPVLCHFCKQVTITQDGKWQQKYSEKLWKQKQIKQQLFWHFIETRQVGVEKLSQSHTPYCQKCFQWCLQGEMSNWSVWWNQYHPITTQALIYRCIVTCPLKSCTACSIRAWYHFVILMKAIKIGDAQDCLLSLDSKKQSI